MTAVPQAYKDIQAIADKFDGETDKFMAAPWKRRTAARSPRASTSR